ncbi:hypothetical protein [Comamonas testosteroni]|uniref:hypothetical protein n=1 Tax=Comamonas testosteroni TaxID=285 RepID=UPI0039194019
MKIDFLEAREMALVFLKKMSTEPGGVDYGLIDSAIKEDEDGWYFPYQSVKFILSKNFDDSLVGNWPIFVKNTGDYVGPRRPGMPINNL